MLFRFIVVLFTLVVGAVSADTLPQIPNIKNPETRIFTGGQPSPRVLSNLREQDIEFVINLRGEDEAAEIDEAGILAREGLEYKNLPIASADDLNLANITRFQALLEEAGDRKVLIHCASGNRVGAIEALRAYWLDNMPEDKALARGEAWGMTRLTGVVREKMRGR